MSPVLDLLLAGAYGIEAAKADIHIDPEIEQLVFVVGPKAASSRTRLRRVGVGLDGNAPKPRSLAGSPESAAWGVSPADRYLRRRLRGDGSTGIRPENEDSIS